MAPKATGNLDGASVKFLLSALKSCPEIAPDWDQVAREHGIKYAKNARPRFNTIVAKFGFRLEDKKIVQLNEDGTKQQDAGVSTPKKTTSPRKSKTPASTKKRKTRDEDGDEEIDQARDGSTDEACENGGGGTEAA